MLPSPIQNLINEFTRLPGIGPKTSERLVFWLLQQPKTRVQSFAETLFAFTQEIHLCSQCFNFSENNSLCTICTNNKRDRTTICIVADNLDLLAMEATGYQGLYHVLGGVVNPLKGKTLEHLHFNELLTRINTEVQEIILAFDPNQEGELTCYYIKKELNRFQIKITRLGIGLPQGGDLDYADEITLGAALKGRREMS